MQIMRQTKKVKDSKKLTNYQKDKCEGCVYKYVDDWGSSTCDYFLLSGQRIKDSKNGKCLYKKLGEKKKVDVSLVKFQVK